MKCDTEKEKTLEQDAWGFLFLLGQERIALS